MDGVAHFGPRSTHHAPRTVVPSYDAAVVGIPQRMRDYNRRKKLQGDL